jgi:UDP-GlcNAc:undecaprenyl-phosphate GlcNAc-1-phosphate transferase
MSNEIIIYLLLNFLIFFSSAKIAYFLKLVDKPSKRKIHSIATAYTGGIALSFILIFSIFIFDIYDQKLNLILSLGLLISLVGLVDDKYSLNVGGKLSLQIIPIFYLIVINDIILTNLGNYEYFDLKLGSFGTPFTLLCVLFLINAFNYFDGLDGTLTLTTISVIGILIFLTEDQNFNLFFMLILTSLVIFLFFNFSFFKLPKMFLGDSGSLTIGFIIAFVLIHISNQKLVHPILLAWSIVIFVYEFISINILRIFRKKRLFKPGQDHLHHLIFKNNNSIYLTNLFICILNVFFFIIGYLSFQLISPLVSLILFVMLFIIFLFFRNLYYLKN